MAPAEFREIGHRLVDEIADRLAALPRRTGHARRIAGRRSARRCRGRATLPPDGADAGAAGERGDRAAVRSLAVQRRIRAFSATSPRARRRSGCSAISWRPRSTRTSARWQLSPLATEIEAQAVRWIARADRLSRELRRAAGQRRQHGELRRASSPRAPPRRGGTCARKGCRAIGRRCSSTRRRKRTRGSRRPPTCPASAPTRSAGLPTDAAQRMDVAALRAPDRRTIGGVGHQPFLVVGTAGIGGHRRRRSAAGDRRDLPRARICGFTSTAPTVRWRRRSPERRRACARLRDADSVAVDPHKWLYAPLEAGCALVRDAEHAARTRFPITRRTTTSTTTW